MNNIEMFFCFYQELKIRFMRIPKRIACIITLNFIALSFLSNNSAYAQSCPTPTNVVITNITSNSAYVDWSHVSGSTGYVVRFKPVNSSSWRRQSSSNSSELITGLLPNTLYEVKVRSSCGSSIGNYCNLVNFMTQSNNVNNCVAPNVYYFSSDNITSNSCLVGWRRVSGASGYKVQYRIRYSNAAWDQGGSSTTNSLQLSGLIPHTLYEFQVLTICGSSQSSWSLSGIFTTRSSVCGAPSGLSASNVTGTTATLSWNSLSCARYYEITYRRSGQTYISDTTSGTQYNLTGLNQGSGYEFKVKSIDFNGSSSSFSSAYLFSTASATCGVPSGLTSSAVGANGATLNWNSVSGAATYTVRYRLAGAQAWQSVTVSSNHASVSGLSADNAYEFQVQTNCTSGSGSYSSMASFITMPNVTSTIPVPDHIVICILENKAFTQLINSSLTPHINALVNEPMTALFTESYGITHPSQPNYIHLFSGANQGVTNNVTPSSHFNTPNLARELLNVGRTFTSYCEGLPSVGYDGSSSGRYQRKHNPVANWVGTRSNQVPATLNQPFSAFPQSNFASLPTVSFVVPDMTNSMHDGSLGTAIATGDEWIYNNMTAYIQWARANNSLFILTTDEDDGSHSNRIMTLITGQMVNHGSYSQPINHHSVLRTIAEMYGLNFIGGSANASPIHGCWTNGFRVRNEESPIASTDEMLSASWNVYPNPAQSEIHASYELDEDLEVAIRIYTNTGSLVAEEKLGIVKSGRHVYDLILERSKYPAGIYFMNITYGTKKYIQRFLITQ